MNFTQWGLNHTTAVCGCYYGCLGYFRNSERVILDDFIILLATYSF